MKESLINIITKITKSTNDFIVKESNNLKFENEKNEMLKIMYEPLLDKKEKEKNLLLSELKKIKEENQTIIHNINKMEQEKREYNNKIKVLDDFERFLLNNR